MTPSIFAAAAVTLPPTDPVASTSTAPSAARSPSSRPAITAPPAERTFPSKRAPMAITVVAASSASKRGGSRKRRRRREAKIAKVGLLECDGILVFAPGRNSGQS